MTPIDISPADLETVRQILRERVPELEVRAFGSRVSWTARETSDLDLVLMTEEPLDISRMAKLKESFSESNLPFRVDIVDWADTSENFRSIIEKKWVVVRKKIEKKQIDEDDWCEVTLGEIAKNFDAQRIPLSKAEREKRYGQYPYYGATRIMDHIDDFLFEGLYLLIAEDGSVEKPDGKPFVQLVNGKFWVNNHAHVLQCSTEEDTKFLYYALSTISIRPYVSGSVQAKLSQFNLKRVPLPYPVARSDRHTIAHILGTLDDKIELNRSISETLESVARALFKSWFVDFDPVRAKIESCWHRGESLPGLPEHLYDFFPDRLVDSELGQIPDGWDMKKLNDVADMTRGRSYRSAELTDSSVALVTLKSFNRGGGYRSEGLKPYIGPYKPEQVVEPGEVIISCTDVTQNAEVIGKPAMVRPNSRYSRLVASLDIMIVRPKNHYISKEFLYLLTGTPMFTNHTYSHSTGTTVLHLAKDAIPSFKFALPPSDVTLAFGQIAENIFGRVFCLEEETNTLTELRNTLLPRLISGELSVNDMRNLITAS